MKWFSVLGLVFTMTVINGSLMTCRASVFINEIHYDNSGTDVNEGVEIAGRTGSDLAGWSIELYNGSNGARYDTLDLTGTLPSQENSYGTLFFPFSGIQNGPEGIALVNPTGHVAQFLSYEGIVTATDGSAVGMTSTDMGVFELTSTPLGYSLQLTGQGSKYVDFHWSAPASSTFGIVNTGQTFVPIPGAVWLLGSGLGCLVMTRNKKK